MNWIYNVFLGICLGFVIDLVLKAFQPKENVKEKVANTKRLLENLIPIATNFVVEAEIQFGKGTGPVKKSYVIYELYCHIPDEYKKYVTEKNLSSIVENAVDQAQETYDFWEELGGEGLKINAQSQKRAEKLYFEAMGAMSPYSKTVSEKKPKRG